MRRSRLLLVAATTSLSAACSSPVTVPTCSSGDVGCLPPRGAALSSGAGDDQTAVFAIRDVLFKQTIDPPTLPNQPWKTVGLNLDGYVTSTADTRMACRTFDPYAHYVFDGDNGIDNEFGARLYSGLIESVLPTLGNDYCCSSARGRGTLLVRLTHWNGTDDDADVTISLLSAIDGTTAASSDVAWDAGAEHGFVLAGTSTPAPSPSWAPNADTWAANSDSYAGTLDSPRHVDAHGYVAGGKFVMALDANRPITFNVAPNPLTFALTDGHLWGRMDPTHAYVVDGGIAGRIGREGLLGMTTDLTGTCVEVTTVNPILQQFADVPLDPAASDPTSLCDAISVGFSFHATRAAQITAAPESLCVRRAECPVGAGNGNSCTSQLGSDTGSCDLDFTGASCTSALPAWPF